MEDFRDNLTVKITMPDGTIKQLAQGTKLSTLIDSFNCPAENIMGILVNNEICTLDKHLSYDAKVSPIMNNTRRGAYIYRRSLCLLLAACAHKLFPNSHLLVGHSLEHGYYYTLHTGASIEKKHIAAIEKEMKAMVEKNLPITSSFVSYEQAIELFEKNGLAATRKQLNFIAPPKIRINTVDGFSDMYFGPMTLTTGALKVFELMPYGEGFLMRFPKASTPEKLDEFKDSPKLYQIYKRYKNWGKQIGVTTAADLNQLLNQRKINEFIAISETFQQKCIADIADQIASKKQAKVILIAGPSSSGKTTTSKKLALELSAIGYRPKVIELDNYYVGRDKNPKDENGNYDYECLEALDIELLNKNLIDLFDGKEVIIPRYDFTDGVPRFEEKNKMHLEKNDILIMEGIHGLNDKLTPKIPAEYKFKIYLSALTQLNLDEHNRISTSNNRLIRRLVRDAQFRGKTAAQTIAMWPSVRRGEELHIFPFQNNADAILNTALDYELSVLKVYAEPLLRCVNPTQPEYSEACILLNFLNNFSPIPAAEVPTRSIIREFIGGSAFKY